MPQNDNDAAFHPIKGQAVGPIKVQRARELRQQMTEAERTLWGELRQLRQRGLIFRRQQIIAGFIVDFYCHAAKLIIEVDGSIHTHQQEYDHARGEVLAAHGLQVLRVTNEEVLAHLDEVIERIMRACG